MEGMLFLTLDIKQRCQEIQKIGVDLRGENLAVGSKGWGRPAWVGPEGPACERSDQHHAPQQQILKTEQ